MLENTITPGQILKSERERQQKTFNDIARHLRLTPTQIRALEEDSYSQLPGQTFVRGFMRNYARHLGLDAQELLRLYEERFAAPPAVISDEPAPQARISFKLPTSWAAGAVVVVAIAVTAIAYITPRQNPALGPQANLPTIDSTPLPSISTLRPIHLNPVKQSSSLPHNTPMSSEEIREVQGEPPSAIVSTPAPQELLARLKFFFEDDAWVEVRDQDKQKIFAHLNFKGTEKVIEGVPPLSLVVGNAKSVRITYNDEEVDLAPYMRNNIAKLSLD